VRQEGQGSACARPAVRLTEDYPRKPSKQNNLRCTRSSQGKQPVTMLEIEGRLFIFQDPDIEVRRSFRKVFNVESDHICSVFENTSPAYSLQTTSKHKQVHYTL
jgi:hypothetical protein